uniref:MACPF domain-containing protein n=1 Tax=Chlamydomonas leiostraca TaxID=1034604 RepID=A0A7S0RE13_9CHLO
MMVVFASGQGATLQQCRTEEGLRAAARGMGASGVNIGKTAGAALGQIGLQSYASMVNTYTTIDQLLAGNTDVNQLYPIISVLPASLGGKNTDPAHLVSAALLDLAEEGPLKLTIPASAGVGVKVVAAVTDPVLVQAGNSSTATDLWLLAPGQSAPAGVPAASQIRLSSTFGILVVKFSILGEDQLSGGQAVQNGTKIVTTRDVKSSAFLTGLKAAAKARQGLQQWGVSTYNGTLGYVPALLKALALPADATQLIARVKNMTGVDLLGKFNYTAVAKNKWFNEGLAIATDCLEQALAENTLTTEGVNYVSWPVNATAKPLDRAAAFSALMALDWVADPGATFLEVDEDKNGNALLGPAKYTYLVDPTDFVEAGETVLYWTVSMYTISVDTFVEYMDGSYSYMTFQGPTPVNITVGGTWNDDSLQLITTDTVPTAHIPGGPDAFSVVTRFYTRPTAVAAAPLTPSKLKATPACNLAATPIGQDVPPYLGNGYNMIMGYPIALSGLEVDMGATMNRVINFDTTSYTLAKDTGVSGCRTGYEESRYMNTQEKRESSETGIGVAGAFQGVAFGLNLNWKSESSQQTKTETQNIKLQTRCIYADATVSGAVDAWTLDPKFKASAIRVAQQANDNSPDFEANAVGFIRAYGTHAITRAYYGAQYMFQTWETTRADAQFQSSGFSWKATASAQAAGTGGDIGGQTKKDTEKKMEELNIKWTKTNVPGNLLPVIDTDLNVDVAKWYIGIKNTAESSGLPAIDMQFTPYTALFIQDLRNLWGDSAPLFNANFRAKWEDLIKSCLKGTLGVCEEVANTCPIGAYQSANGCRSCYTSTNTHAACSATHALSCVEDRCTCEDGWDGSKTCDTQSYGRCVSNYNGWFACPVSKNLCTDNAKIAYTEYFSWHGCYCKCCYPGTDNCGCRGVAGDWCKDSE